METPRVRPKYRILVAVLISVVGLAGCSSPTAPTPPPPAATPPPVTPPPPLSLTCPPAANGTSTTGAPVPVTFNAPETSGGLTPIVVTCTGQSGTPFPVGTTAVECSASDAASQSASCSFNVIVEARIPRLTKTKIMAFGDSFTAGEIPIASSPSSGGVVPNFSLIFNPDVAYPTQLATLLRGRYVTQPQIEVINMGLHGETAEEGAKRLPSRISQNRPEVLLLLEGANDLSFYGSAGIPRAWLAIDTMAKEGRNRGLRVFIATLPPPRPGFRSTLPDGWITSLNDRIRITARSEGAYLVDIYGALAPSVTQYIGIDGLHPSEAGYGKMAETFFDAIRVDLEAR